MDLETLRHFLGLCTVINVGMFTLTVTALLAFRRPVMALHGRLFGLEQETLPPIYFRFLAVYKLGTVLLNLTPWLALQAM